MEKVALSFDEKAFRSIKSADCNRLLNQILKCRTVGDYRALAKKFMKKSEKEQLRELKLLSNGDIVFYDALRRAGKKMEGGSDVVDYLLQAEPATDSGNMLRLRRMM